MSSNQLPVLNFYQLQPTVKNLTIARAPVPGGWLVWITSGAGPALTFYPDPTHQWDGGSLY
jgi:hypothetical protein